MTAYPPGENDGQDVDGDEPAPLHVGDHVRDRDHDDGEDGPTMVVVGLPLQRCASYWIDGQDKTIADVNPNYPDEEPVAEVVFPDRTDSFLCEQKVYAYPEARLKRVASVHDVDEDGEGSDAE